MKFPRATPSLSVCFLLSTLSPAQVAQPDEQDYSKFVINANKPYVYLEVDHVGPREPLRNDEPNIGIWLHLKNNCKLPIVVLALGERHENVKEGIALEDEVVPDPIAPVTPTTRGDGSVGGIVAPHGLGEMLDLFRWRNMTEDEIRRAEERQRATSKPVERPRGYGSQNGFNSFVMTLIAPGDQVYFSVPANHVSKTWHFEVPFRLAVPNSSRIRPPYSYVAFYQEDLDKAQVKAPAPTTR
jgi:hypothetical protein